MSDLFFDMKKTIRKKACRETHDMTVITNMIENYMNDTISDAQMAAWLMAVCINGLTADETSALTTAMTNSGDRVEWPDDIRHGHYLVDKHSSGGVGDKTSLIIVPLIASMGVPVVKLSGRGLGHTGGTIDKLESIPGFNSVLRESAIQNQMDKVGAYIGAQTAELAPADARLYALRNETATVENESLIASSILSKKFASGADAFVFDVKVGRGAFMKTLEEAQSLATLMHELVKKEKKRATFLLTNMNEPLGTAIGNALEVKEVISILKGEQTGGDLVELPVALAARMLDLSQAKIKAPMNELEDRCRAQLASGLAYRKFNEMIAAQGGDLSKLEFMETEFTFDYYSEQTGIIQDIDALVFGEASKRLGAGVMDGKPIDPMAGIVLDKKVGDPVFGGERIAKLHYEITRSKELYPVLEDLKKAVKISQEPVSRQPIILQEIS